MKLEEIFSNDDPILKEYMNLIYEKFRNKYSTQIRVTEGLEKSRGSGLDSHIGILNSNLCELIFDCKNFRPYLITIETNTDKLKFLYRLKALLPERRNNSIKSERVSKIFLSVVETEIEELKTFIQIEQDRKQKLVVEKSNSDKSFSLRIKVLTLLLLTFGELEKPEYLIQERIVEFFYKIIGGDISKIREIVSRPTAHKESNQSIKHLCDDLITVRNQLGQFGFKDHIEKINNELKSFIEDFDEDETEEIEEK